MRKVYEPYGPNYDPKKKESNTYASNIRMCAGIFDACCSWTANAGCGPTVNIPQGHVGYKMEFGRYVGQLGAGVHYYNPIIQTIKVVDARRTALNLPLQKLLTKELLEVTVQSKVTYGFYSREVTSFTINDYIKYMRNTSMGIMKALVSERTLEDLQVNIKDFNKACQKEVSKQLAPYGIEVFTLEITSLRLPPVLIKALAVEA